MQPETYRDRDEEDGDGFDEEKLHQRESKKVQPFADCASQQRRLTIFNWLEFESPRICAAAT